MDPELVIVVAVLAVVAGMIAVAYVHHRRTAARLAAAARVEAPIVSQLRVALLLVATLVAGPGAALGAGVAFGLDGLVVILAVLILSAFGIGAAVFAPWNRVGAVVLDLDALRVDHPDPHLGSEIDLGAPFELEEGWGERGRLVMITVGVHQARRRPIYFHYPMPLRGAAAIPDQPPGPVRGFALGAEGRVVHERLRARTADAG